MMGDTSDSNIVVEVIVWDGSAKTRNGFGHVTTKITKNGIPYSYSLESSDSPRIVCNTEKFLKLERKEQRVRDGIGFVLNVTQDQAKSIFLSMQTRFHAYNTKSCIYHAAWHNCTYAIQESIQKSGIDIYKANEGRTLLPAKVEYALLRTKNNKAHLVKEIIEYKKGQDRGTNIIESQSRLLFNIVAIHQDGGWYTDDKPIDSENW